MLKRLLSSLNLGDEFCRFARTFDAVAFLIHQIYKSLDPPMKSVGCALLDYSYTFDSVPQSLQLHKMEAFGCPKPLLA